jgi:hypothetical protein
MARGGLLALMGAWLLACRGIIAADVDESQREGPADSPDDAATRVSPGGRGGTGGGGTETDVAVVLPGEHDATAVVAPEGGRVDAARPATYDATPAPGTGVVPAGGCVPPSDGGACGQQGPEAFTPSSPPMCDPTGGAGPCGDTQKDPHNCGVCGHDCQGGPCVAGTCQPCILATGQNNDIRSIAIDSDHLYFSEEVFGALPTSSYSYVRKVPLAGGGITTLVSGIQYINTVAVDGTALYFLQYYGTSSGSVQSVPLSGGSPSFLATFSSGSPSDMTLDGQSLYVTVLGGSNSVVLVPTSGGPTRTLAAGSRQIGGHGGVAYVVDGRGNVTGIAATGGSVNQIGNFANAQDFAFYGSDMYLLNLDVQGPRADGSLVRIPMGGSPQTTLASCLDLPINLAVDDTGIYWGQNNWLVRLTPGCQSVLSTSASQYQGHVHLDAKAIYWIDGAAGPTSPAAVKKLAK